MRIVSIGGGPAGLYFGILMKGANPAHEVTVYERNRAGDTFGFGVVFSDATLDKLEAADPPTYKRITESFAHWDDIDTHFQGQVQTSTGHGFSGMSRKTLLDILAARATELGVEIRYETEVTDFDAIRADADLVLGADGVNSQVRAHYADHFRPQVDFRPNRFIWLGTTFPFGAFTFYFKENAHGLFRVHAYRYEEGHSTFIVECTEETWRAAGLDETSEDESVAYCAELFADELAGHPLIKNRSIWRQFPNITNERWSHENVVLMGDALHTAHFSIGSGTKLAMEDAIALRDALAQADDDVQVGLQLYDTNLRPAVEALQRAAQVSLEWFENTERYMGLEPEQFGFSLLTRSLRITHDNLRVRDPAFVRGVDEWFHNKSSAALGLETVGRAPPPMFNRLRLRDMELSNRIAVSPMCQYSAEDGTVDDWHLVHLGSRAMGGAGLVIAEMTDVSRDGRISPGCAGMYKPDHVPAWRRITDFVHKHSDAKIALQLGHAGRKGSTKLLWEGMDEPLPADAQWPLLAASAIPYKPGNPVPAEMTAEDMDRVEQDYIGAAELAHQAGFDMLELHCAHGYLLASFLSPLTNQRTDGFGGSIENRLRFPLRIFDAIRKVWPDERPISVRLSATDWHPDGITMADTLTVAKAFTDAGADILDVSTGQTDPAEDPQYGRLFQTPFSERIRLELGVPTMTVGAISSYADANSILAAGRADVCVLARAHLFDPYWTRHAAYEQGVDPSWPPQYAALSRYNFRFK